MASDLTASGYRQRAAQMRALAADVLEPAFRRSCEDLAEGWEALALEQEAQERATARGPAQGGRQNTMRTISLRSRSV